MPAWISAKAGNLIKACGIVDLGCRLLALWPAWAGPVQPMEEWDAEWVANTPVAAKPFLQSRNTTGEEWQQSHKPEGMQCDAPGINPDRWGR